MSRFLRNGREQLCPSAAKSPLLRELLIPGFLFLILSSFSLLFSSQLKAPRWQIPSSKPTQACSTMQVSNFASRFFPLSPLCSSPLVSGGERYPGVEPQDWGQRAWAWINAVSVG